MGNDDVSVGELARRLEASTADIKATVTDVKSDLTLVAGKVDKLSEVHAVLASHTVRLDGHDREIKELKTNNASRGTKQAVWLGSVAAVVSAFISLLGLALLYLSHH